MRARRLLRRQPPARKYDEGGAAAVEFALILPVLLLVLFGIVQYGYYFFAAQNGSSVAREAARKVAVGDCPTQSDLNSFVSSRLGGLAHSNLNVTRTYYTNPTPPATPTVTTTPAIGGKVKLVVRFDTMDMNLPFIPVPGNASVARVVDARIEDLTAGSC